MRRKDQMKIEAVTKSFASLALFLVLFLGWPLYLGAQCVLGPEQVESHFKSITSYENYVVVHGRWKRTAGNTTFHKPPRINTVFITCDKDTMTCKEIIAELVTPQEESMFDKPQLYIDENTYRVIDWTNDTVRATFGALVADFEIRISVKDRIAERHWRETKARGAKTSDARNFENWILE
jgi:hypothetical protein